MRRHLHFDNWGLLLLGVILLLLAAISVFVFSLSLTKTFTGYPAGELVGLTNYTTVLRTYNLRVALKNTLQVAAAVQVIAWLLALVTWRFWPNRRWQQVGIVMLLLLPALLPAPLIGELWRRLLAPYHLLLTPKQLLLLLVAAEAWHLWPYLVALRVIWHRSGDVFGVRMVCWISAIGAYLVVADASIPLVLTSGAPHNATHLLAGWIFQNVYVSGNLGQGAAMVSLLWGLLLPLAMIILYFMPTKQSGNPIQLVSIVPQKSRTYTVRERPQSELLEWVLTNKVRATFLGNYILSRRIGYGLIWGLLALLVAIPWFGALGYHNDVQVVTLGLGDFLRSTHYVRWLINTVAIVLVALLFSLLIMPTGTFVPQEMKPWIQRLRGALFVLGLLNYPVLYLPLCWIVDQYTLPDGLWVNPVLNSMIVLILSLGIVSITSKRARPTWQQIVVISTAISFFVTVHEYTILLVLRLPITAQPIGFGMVANLSRHLAVGPFLFAFAAMIALFALLFIVYSVLRPNIIWAESSPSPSTDT